MTLVAHLAELRTRVGRSLLAVLLATAVAFWWYEHGLGDFIRAPYCGLPDELRYSDADGGCGLLITDVFGGALIRLKISFIVGIVLSAPAWLFQLWRFVTPGLERDEKLYGIGFAAASSGLFALGSALAYVSLAAGLRLLLGLAGDGVVVALTAQDYIGFVISLLLAFGVSFELPLVAVMLNLAGVLSYAALSGARRWIFFLTIVFAAFVTPTQDPFTMLVMAAPMVLLFETAIQIARLVDRRRARRAATEGFSDLADDEASPLDTAPSALDDLLVPTGRRAELHPPAGPADLERRTR
ncbi:twin-arginine translocase subunit TatC [Blastococcus capsensis]|uniref:twin-arginine translocase subunit TatC n=1 Tax=Blastococcus capsensis TaxID=1564163 RepID=UPI0025410DBE|nr:twin-arginine translocase subunit TatC [Blastococcus capsensis]MDK3255640.1 twin-arginine translocase subunit TatC [Blastococcus capsensis]